MVFVVSHDLGGAPAKHSFHFAQKPHENLQQAMQISREVFQPQIVTVGNPKRTSPQHLCGKTLLQHIASFFVRYFAGLLHQPAVVLRASLCHPLFNYVQIHRQFCRSGLSCHFATPFLWPFWMQVLCLGHSHQGLNAACFPHHCHSWRGNVERGKNFVTTKEHPERPKQTLIFSHHIVSVFPCQSVSSVISVIVTVPHFPGVP